MRFDVVSIEKHQDAEIFAICMHTSDGYLMIQKNLAPSQQDIQLGQAGFYFEINDQLNSSYLDFLETEITKEGLSIVMDKKGSYKIGVNDKLDLRIDHNTARDIHESLSSI